jgi:hypothetical protein
LDRSLLSFPLLCARLVARLIGSLALSATQSKAKHFGGGPNAHDVQRGLVQAGHEPLSLTGWATAMVEALAIKSVVDRIRAFIIGSSFG